MGNIAFPIIEETGNQLLSINGNRAYFYKIELPDLEQLSPHCFEEFFNGISRDLCILESKSYYKFFSLGGNAYLETNFCEKLNFSSIKTIPQDNPLKIFFGDSEIISDVGIYDDYLNYNGKYVRILSVLEFSGRSYPNIIPIGVDYVLTVKKISKRDAISKLERIRSSHFSSFFKKKRDISGEGTYQQAENLLRKLIHEEESLFKVELFFILKSHSLEELCLQTHELQNELASRGIKLFIEGQSLMKIKSGLSHLFNELVPGVYPNLELRAHFNKSSHLRYLIPSRASRLMDTGVTFHDQEGDEIYFNPFEKSLKNRNMLVTGETGSGKSVFVNKLVHHLVGKYPAVILDKGGSFKKLAIYHGSNILEKEFNPMQFRDAKYLREIILSVVDPKKFDRMERGRLLKSIKEALNQAQDFNALLVILEKDFKGISLYFEEIKDFVSSNKIGHQRILYVDIDKYPRIAVAPLIIFVLRFFQSIPQNEKVLVFDECWNFLQQHASYIEECFRTFRKTGAFPIAISQGISDFSCFKKEVGDAICNNSYFKVYFSQKRVEDKELTDFDWDRIKGLQFKKNVFSDCYLKSSDNSFQKIIRNFLTPLELELFNTESIDNDKIFKFISQFGEIYSSSSQAIDSYVRLKYGSNKEDYNFFNSLASSTR